LQGFGASERCRLSKLGTPAPAPARAFQSCCKGHPPDPGATGARTSWSPGRCQFRRKVKTCSQQRTHPSMSNEQRGCTAQRNRACCACSQLAAAAQQHVCRGVAPRGGCTARGSARRWPPPWCSPARGTGCPPTARAHAAAASARQPINPKLASQGSSAAAGVQRDMRVSRMQPAWLRAHVSCSAQPQAAHGEASGSAWRSKRAAS